MKVFTLLTLLTMSLTGHAADPCGDRKSQELDRATNGEKAIIVCGVKYGDKAGDLLVLVKDGKEIKEAFKGDDETKLYSLEKKGNSFEIEESLSIKGFRPYMLHSYACGEKWCNHIKTACVWSKAKPNKKIVKEIKNLIKAKEKDIEVTLAEVFFSMLNGNKEAQKFFDQDTLESAGRKTKNDFLAYKSDVKRLKKAGCIK